MNEDWHVISGKWEIGKTSFMHKGNDDRTFPDSLIINKNKLIDGEIKANIVFNTLSSQKPPDSASVVFRYQSPHNYYFAGIAGYNKKFVIGKRIPQGSYAINALGLGQEIEAKTIYNIALAVSGRKFSLFLNGKNGRIKIIDAVDTIEPFYDGGNMGIKVFDKEDVTISDYNFDVKKPRCFVVMPFGDNKLNELKVYKDIIKKAVEKNKLKSERSDEILGNRPIIMDIVEAIDTSLITICEITKNNENVFYELGIAHAKNANVILLCDKQIRRKLPFDISHIRCIYYDSNKIDKNKITKELKQTIGSILDKTMNYAQQGYSLNF